MPGTAATQNQSRTHTKARPSANARPASLLESTPVLFRLPTIETAATKDLAATFSEAAVSLPTATLSAVASTASVAPDTAPTQPEATPHLTKDRTWWEHWSSGIVLIVLLIALATASILAWQGNSKDKAKLLADTKQQDETESSLASIEIPKLDQPRIEPSAAASAMKANTEDSAATKSLQPASDTTEELSLIPDPKSLSFDTPKSSANDTNTASSKATLSKPEPAATASLQKPLAKSQEPLFKDAPASSSSSISAQPASSPKPSVWDKSGSTKSTADKPAADDTGLILELDPPTNVSATNTNSATSNDSLISAAAPGSTNATSRTPGELVSQSHSTSTSSQLPSATSPSSTAPSTSQAAGQQYAGKTATPELDRAALFATFRQYSGADKAAAVTDTATNRYKSPSTGSTNGMLGTAPTQTSIANTQPNTGVAASTVGFTQTPGTTTPATAPSYTLQSPSATTPSFQQSGTQQRPTTGTSVPQFPSQFNSPTTNPTQLNNQSSAPQQPTGQPTNSLMTSGLQPANASNGYYIPPVTSTNPLNRPAQNTSLNSAPSTPSSSGTASGGSSNINLVTPTYPSMR